MQKPLKIKKKAITAAVEIIAVHATRLNQEVSNIYLYRDTTLSR